MSITRKARKKAARKNNHNQVNIMAEKKIKIIAENRKARHDFTIHETYEALVLS